MLPNQFMHRATSRLKAQSAGEEVERVKGERSGLKQTHIQPSASLPPPLPAALLRAELGLCSCPPENPAWDERGRSRELRETGERREKRLTAVKVQMERSQSARRCCSPPPTHRARSCPPPPLQKRLRCQSPCVAKQALTPPPPTAGIIYTG